MLTDPYELTTISGDDLAAVRRSFARVTGTLTLPNLAALAALNVPEEVREVTILGAVAPGDAGPPMIMRRVDSPVTTHTGWVRSLDRYKRSPGVIRNSDFSNDTSDSETTLINCIISGGVLTGGSVYFIQANTLVNGAVYDYSFEYKVTVGTLYAILTDAGAGLHTGSLIADNTRRVATGTFTSDGTTFKLLGWGNDITGQVDNLTVVPKTGVVVPSETYGGYWEYVSKNQPVYIEWFGGRSDFQSVSQATGSAVVNSSPTDNKPAFERASRFLYTAAQGNGYIGPTIQLGYGAYYISDTPDFDRVLTIQGMGSGFQNTSTRIIVAPGKTGLFVKGFVGGQGGQTTVRDLELRSLGFGGVDTAHGIDMKSMSIVENCTIVGFGGNGVNISSGVEYSTNANCCRIKGCFIADNKKSGMYFQGGDSNACHTDSCSLMGNGAWAIEDMSFLGNAHHGHQASTNGDPWTGAGGAYYAFGSNGPTTFVGCYSEGDQPASFAGHLTVFVGGLHAAGIENDDGSYLMGNYWIGGLKVEPRNALVRAGDYCYLRLREGGANVLWEFGSGNSLSHGGEYPPFDYRYFPNLGFFLHYANIGGDLSYGVTPSEGCTTRNPRIKPNNIVLGKGVFIGSQFDITTYLTSAGSPPANINVEYKPGDLCIDNAAGALGWMCSAGGITTNTTWTSGTEYEVGAVVRTGAGKVYQLTRKPYNPDAWTMPGSTVKPTHTTPGQIVNYPEPNPQIDPGEGTTIPGYSWQLHPDPIVIDLFWNSGQIYVVGSYVYVRGPDLYYVCSAVPTAPTPIFNQAWAMPKSTVVPTHTSGAVECPEPNPSPSGSEPGTIPGYVWNYVSSSPAPVWSRVGARFYRGSVVHDAASLAAGAVSGDITISVSGATMGDFPTISCSIDTPGLAIVNQRVSATDTVKFRLWNVTGGAIDLASATFYASIER